jgi:4-aminobutyrate aminotransferase/(S)-3-amino-2-methylpropionate transaminase
MSMSKAISLITSIPGPRSLALAERRAQAVSSAISAITPVYVRRAHGAIVEDVDGNRLLDFAGGIGCVNAGHAPADVVKALQQQAEDFLHTCFMVAGYEGYIALAERLNRLAPGSSEKRTILLNSGAEAVENSIKIARSFTGRTTILCFDNAFHGRTYMAMALTAKEKPYKDGFAPFPGDVVRVPYPYCYRCDCAKQSACCISSDTALAQNLFRDVHPGSVAAIIVEPVLGEGGFIVPPPEFLPALRRICSLHGIVLIADEIQTGFGRTGKLFACEHAGIEPDLLLTAKSIASGLPISAVTGKVEIMNHPVAGALGGTFGGNPLACAAALATLDLFEHSPLCDRSVAIGELFRRRALRWQQEFDCIGDVRGLGAMQAIEFVEDRITKKPDAALTKQIVKHACQNGLLLVTAGSYGNVLRLLVPISASDAEVEEGLDVIEAALHAVAAANASKEVLV